MASDAKKITDVLMELGEEKAKARLRAIHDWARNEPIAVNLLPSLMSTASARYTTRNAKLPKGVATGQELVDGLEHVHAKTFAVLFEEPFECTTTTVSNFKTKGHHPSPFPLETLFLLWLSETIADNQIPPLSRINGMLSIFNFVSAVEAFIADETPLPKLKVGTTDAPLLAAHQLPPSREADQIAEGERNVSRFLGRLIGVENLAPDVINNDFFQHNPSKACFVLYRLGVENDVIKGFLVIQPPKTGNDDAYSFNHYYSDGINDRETRGFVLSVAQRHYFVGASGYKAVAKRPLLNEGMKFMVIDRNTRAQQGLMWGALFLSHDGAFKPIAGRCILIRSKFDHSRHADIGPVRGDLRADIEKYCDVEPGVLEQHMERILLAIDNSYEPSRSKGGDQNLMGPLTIVPPIA
jgi:hypothetical protein